MNLTNQIQKSKPRKNGEVPIMSVYRINGKETYISTGRNINPIHWNKDSADSPVRASYGDGYITLNLFLKNFRNQHGKIADEFYIINNRFPTPAEFKSLCAGKTAQPTKQQDFFALYNQFTRYQSTQRGNKNVSLGTFENYRQLQARVRRYKLILVEYPLLPVIACAVGYD